MDRPIVYRVQDSNGRGPWRPGFSKHWIDEESTLPLPADVLSAFGLKWRSTIPPTWHCGCACRSMAALLKWFTPVERNRLEQMGFSAAMMRADKIVCENADQLVFARKLPLSREILLLPWTATDPGLLRESDEEKERANG